MAIQQEKIHVLHVTPWFPTLDDPTNALFIQRHIQSLEPFCSQTIVHIDVRMTDFPVGYGAHQQVHSFHRKISIKSWALLEWTFYRTLKKFLKESDARENFTHVNFHIAYPAMMHFQKLEKWLPKKQLITEHWSAYHFNFNAPKKPLRLRKLFWQNIPVAAVSRSLSDDIQRFSEKNIPISILPNVVDIKVFNCHNLERKEHYLTAALWKFPKRPLEVLQSIKEKRDAGKSIHLRIAGMGPYEEEILQFIKTNRLENCVTYLGRLTAEEFAAELNVAKAFLLPSGYETFSTVIAEAFCCGCPVIASNAGAISDHIEKSTGILVNDSNWVKAFDEFEANQYDSSAIAQRAQKSYSMETIGEKYFQLLQNLK